MRAPLILELAEEVRVASTAGDVRRLEEAALRLAHQAEAPPGEEAEIGALDPVEHDLLVAERSHLAELARLLVDTATRGCPSVAGWCADKGEELKALAVAHARSTTSGAPAACSPTGPALSVGGVAAGDDGTVLWSLPREGAIWRMDRHGFVAPLVSPGTLVEDEVGWSAGFSPVGLDLGRDGRLYAADRLHHRVVTVGGDGSVRVLAGGANGEADGEGGSARFRFPRDLVIGPDGCVLVADTGNDRVRTVSPDGLVSTLAGSVYDHLDGRGPLACFRRPHAIAPDGSGGYLVADTGNHAVRVVGPGGDVRTLAGGPVDGPSRPGAPSLFSWPLSVAPDGDGGAIVLDGGDRTLRRITADGRYGGRIGVPPAFRPDAIVRRGSHGLVVVGVSTGSRHAAAEVVLVDTAAGDCSRLVAS
ncbi:MAG TPA: hypothetical protein VFN50_11450 [Acidimicrobiales bacterium]|nr:hypothetical protein [Acidimicrobiales bacterium]